MPAWTRDRRCGFRKPIAINALFIQHYQETARAHFTVRRLERAHGAEAVRRAYGEVT